MEKTFTLQEANSLIPKIAGIFDEISALSGRADDINRDIENLLSIWGDELFDSMHIDNKYYEQKVKERTALAKELHENIEKIHETGAIVKDIGKGLVDFYFNAPSGPVLLCWKSGESEILYWHTIESGLPGRRPIAELLNAPVPRTD